MIKIEVTDKIMQTIFKITEKELKKRLKEIDIQDEIMAIYHSDEDDVWIIVTEKGEYDPAGEN